MSDLDDSFRPIAVAPTSTVSALQTRPRHYR
jgi:hypothetical protein